ncbi:MAG: phosphoesterase [Desulfobacteraceae bacterium]|nr:phosphoesterase [Desulfobacteraceae bacterium]
MNSNERVLSVKRDLLPPKWVEQKCIMKLELETFINACSDAGYEFKKRGEAENDPSFKQIIPYIMLQTADLKQTAIYNRQGSEKRLHDLWSVGIGGHINPIDAEHNNKSFKQILLKGMERELTEELEKRNLNETPQFTGIINEDITEVGSVHIGAVFRVLTKTPEIFKPGEELSQFKWVPTQTVKQLNLELWSTLALELASYT